jgi:hypothetical protein
LEGKTQDVPRLNGKSGGFKVDACNPSKDCLYCSIESPTLSGRVIRSLGKDFCKILATQLDDEGLQKKKLSKKGASVVQTSQAIKRK